MITEPYLLVLNMPLHRHQGCYWAEPLWRKDLEAHLANIADLSIACPVKHAPPPNGWERLARTDIAVRPLPAMGRLSILLLPYMAIRLWQIIAATQIVHTGVAGWPFALGWIAIPLARLRRKFVVVVVESAFWRIPPGMAASRVARTRARFSEAMNRRMIALSDLCFFTTEAYRDTLHAGAAENAYVLPASWVDDSHLIAEDRLVQLGNAKGAAILFAGRLTEGKGVHLLLEAIARSGVAVDIVGEGPLHDAVMEAQRASPALVTVLEPVEYGEAFSTMIDRYAALVVPTISDEQPRIIFDAFARGVPVLASTTPGNRQIVDHGRNGLLFAANDVGALTEALRSAARDPARLRVLGRAARQDMAAQTHAAMHAVRAETIATAFSRRREPR